MPEGIDGLVPSMHVNVPDKVGQPEPKAEIISDERLLGVYDDILKTVKDDREEIDLVLSHFVNVVVNDGDSSGPSKEALVNLMKMKVDQSDKMTKMADLMTRLKMKDKVPQGGPWLAANQTNTINVGVNDKRALIKALNNAKKDRP